MLFEQLVLLNLSLHPPCYLPLELSEQLSVGAVSYTHLTLPTTPYV